MLLLYSIAPSASQTSHTCDEVPFCMQLTRVHAHPISDGHAVEVSLAVSAGSSGELDSCCFGYILRPPISCTLGLLNCSPICNPAIAMSADNGDVPIQVVSSQQPKITFIVNARPSCYLGSRGRHGLGVWQRQVNFPPCDFLGTRLSDPSRQWFFNDFAEGEHYTISRAAWTNVPQLQ